MPVSAQAKNKKKKRGRIIAGKTMNKVTKHLLKRGVNFNVCNANGFFDTVTVDHFR